MTTLTKAPLIEAIFEMRWGEVSREAVGSPVQFHFSEDDSVFFLGRFQAAALNAGFGIVERANPQVPTGMQLNHVVTHRFRNATSAWPCYQVGLGVMTANQVNEGYEWRSFKETVLNGLEILAKSYPSGIATLKPIGVELKYQDGFLFDEKESSADFLGKKLNFGFSVPSDFLSMSETVASGAEGISLGFRIKLNRPQGHLVTHLNEGKINNRPGYLMEAAVRSADGPIPAFTTASLSNWLEEAHDVQKTAFASFISPVYLKSFK